MPTTMMVPVILTDDEIALVGAQPHRNGGTLLSNASNFSTWVNELVTQEVEYFERRRQEEAADAVAIPNAIAALTLDTTFEDYAREESSSYRQNARFMADWVADLEEVGAEILGTPECGEYSSEVNFRITIRQAHQLNYDDMSIYDHVVENEDLFAFADRSLQWSEQSKEKFDQELSNMIHARLEELFEEYEKECSERGVPLVIASRDPEQEQDEEDEDEWDDEDEDDDDDSWEED